MLTTVQPSCLLDDQVHDCIEQIVSESGVSGGHTKTLVRPFVQGLQLLETYNTAWHTRSRLFTVLDSEKKHLWPIYDASSLHRIRYGCDIDVHGEEAVRWLQVFTLFCQHEGDPFAIVGSAADLEWLCGRKVDIGGDPKLSSLHEPRYTVSEDQTCTLVETTVLHLGSIFKCAFTVGEEPARSHDRPKLSRPGGWVHMLCDEPLGDIQAVCDLSIFKPRSQ